MAAGSILIDLILRTAQFETDTKRAEKRLAELKKEAEAMGVAVGAAFALVGAASVAMVKHAIDNMDEMGKMAQKVGTSVESFSALAYAADLAGVSQEQLGSALVKLSKNMSDAAQGTGDAAKAFDALGINVKNADGSLKSSDQVLSELAGKFAGYKDSVEKTALAVAIFGKAGAEMIPLLNGGADGLAKLTEEARQLGVILDTESGKAAEEFNDNLTRMGYAVRGVANQAAKELLPTLVEVSQMFLDMVKSEEAVGLATDVVKGAVGGLIALFKGVAVIGSDVAFVFTSLGREIGAWGAQLAALGRGELGGFHAISDAVKADGERARAELDKFQARVMAIGQPGGGLDEEARRRLGRGGGKTAAPMIPGAAGAKGKADKPYATSDKWDAVSAAEAEARIMNEAQQAWAKYEAQVAKANEPLAEVAVKMSELDRITEDVGQAFGNAISDLVIGGASAKEVFGSLLKTFAQLILQVGVLEPMMAALKQSMGGGGGVPANPYAAGSGGGIDWAGIMSSVVGAFGGGMAEGGPVHAGKSYVVGERGPEMFVPRTAGMVIPNHALDKGGTLSIINQTSGRVDRAVEQRVSARDRAILLQENESSFLGKLGNPNSDISKAMQKQFGLRPARS